MPENTRGGCAMSGSFTVLGMMSGTSVDTIDVALCEFEPGRNGPGEIGFRLLGYREEPHSLREGVLELLAARTVGLDELTELNFLLGEAFAAAASSALAALDFPSVDLIASHGQTIYHLVAPGRTRSTLQLGEPAVIALSTGKTVVADFRVADMAAGGQGAPLVSYFDAAYFAHSTRTRAVQNIGGMANVTFVPPGGPEHAYAFDTGPGNVLIDRAVFLLSAGAAAYDREGARASRGTVHGDLLAEILAHPYFSQPAPKTAGREIFGDALADRIVERAATLGLRVEDTIATLTAVTVESILRAYRDFAPARIDDVIVSGGGIRNATLMQGLRERLPGCALHDHDSFGVPAAAKEAVAFALLGYEALHGRRAVLPRCTGAARASILGKIVPGANYRELLGRVAAEGSEWWETSRTLRLLP